MPSKKCCIWSLLLLGVVTAPVFSQDTSSARRQNRVVTGQSMTRRHLADYSSALPLANGRVDVDALVQRLKELGVNTYYWLVVPWSTWEDLKLFLPKAEKAGIDVWVYLVPPSESPPESVQPFRLDYVAWGEGIARLSLEHANLNAWVIDDFYGNRGFFTPALMREIRTRSRAINPRLAFLPLMYFPELQAKFLEDYRGVIDGAVVAYLEDRDEIGRTWAFFNDGDTLPASEFLCPPNTPTRTGDYVMASQSVRVLPGNDYQIRFLDRDGYSGGTAGYHFKQLLVDGKVVWEQDVAGNPDGPQEVVVDVTDLARGKASLTLAFRLLEKQGVGNFSLNWHVKQLRGKNLQLADDTTRPEKWNVSRQGPLQTGFGTTPKPGRHRFHLPFISMTAAQPIEFRMRHGDPATPERIAGQLRLSLQAWQDGKCDGVVTYCLDKRPQSGEFPAVQKLFHRFGAVSGEHR
jgi:hypothetical protein